MPFHVTTMYFVLLASTLLLALFFSFLYRLKHQDYLLAWSVAWGLFCIHFFTGVLMKLSGSEVWLKLDGIVNETVLVIGIFRVLLRRAAVRGPSNFGPRCGRSGRHWLGLVDRSRESLGGSSCSPRDGHSLSPGWLHILGGGPQAGSPRRFVARHHLCRLGLARSFGDLPRSDGFAARRRSVPADGVARTLHLRADGDGGVRRGAAPRRAQHARALESEPGCLRLCGRRNPQDAGPGARSRAQRGPHSRRHSLRATNRAPRVELRDRHWIKRNALRKRSTKANSTSTW